MQQGALTPAFRQQIRLHEGEKLSLAFSRAQTAAGEPGWDAPNYPALTLLTGLKENGATRRLSYLSRPDIPWPISN